MKLKRYWRRGMGLAALGIALAAFALINLHLTPDISEAIAFAPEEKAAQSTETEEAPPSALSQLIKRYDGVKADIIESLPNTALYAFTYGAALSSDAGNSMYGTLTAVDAGYFETYEKLLVDGYWFTGAQLSGGANVAVLDEQLAFELFPTTEPLRGKLTLGAQSYDIIGIVKHKKTAGDIDKYGAYVPLRALAKEADSGMDYIALAAKTGGETALARAFAETAKLALGEGTFTFDLNKELMRAMMLLRALAVIYSAYILMFIMRKLNAHAAQEIRWFKTQLSQRYLYTLLPALGVRILIFGVLYALWLGGGYLTLRLVIAPMYVFTEWIPDVIVEWSSVSGRAKELMLAAAQPVKLQTRAVATLRLYGKLLNVGLIMLLCACAPMLLSKKRKSNE